MPPTSGRSRPTGRCTERSAASRRWACSGADGRIRRSRPARTVRAGVSTASQDSATPPWRRPGAKSPPERRGAGGWRPRDSNMLAFASAIVRQWTRLYTWRLPPAVRDARRAEIESDLWEFSSELKSGHVSSSAAAIALLERLRRGIPDDLTWRLAEGGGLFARPRSMWVLVASTIAVVTALWAVHALTSSGPLPTPPRQWDFVAAPPPPPRTVPRDNARPQLHDRSPAPRSPR